MKNILEYNGYMGSVEYSSDDDCFFGKVLAINDVVTFEGNSTDELKAAFHEAVDDYLKLCVRQGKDPEKPYKGSFNVRIDPLLHRKAVQYAAAQGITLNKLVEGAIKNQIEPL